MNYLCISNSKIKENMTYSIKQAQTIENKNTGLVFKSPHLATLSFGRGAEGEFWDLGGLNSYMKKSIILLFILFPSFLMSQNLQVLYDFGNDRNYVTTTLEMYKPDKWGSTFYFVDFYYDFGPEKHPSGAYMEIARSLQFWKGPITAHIEYNGGLGSYPYPLSETGYAAYKINSAWLIGADYTMHNVDFTKLLTLQAMFKHIVGKQESAQLTAIWGLHFFKRKLSFTGFADFWLENNAANTTITIFISQPQLWYNISEQLSAGTEIEFANNFAGTDGFMVRPKLAVKWNF